MAKPALAPVPAAPETPTRLADLERVTAAAAIVPAALLPIWQKVFVASRACGFSVEQAIERADQALV